MENRSGAANKTEREEQQQSQNSAFFLVPDLLMKQASFAFSTYRNFINSFFRPPESKRSPYTESERKYQGSGPNGQEKKSAYGNIFNEAFIRNLNYFSGLGHFFLGKDSVWDAMMISNRALARTKAELSQKWMNSLFEIYRKQIDFAIEAGIRSGRAMEKQMLQSVRMAEDLVPVNEKSEEKTATSKKSEEREHVET